MAIETNGFEELKTKLDKVFGKKYKDTLLGAVTAKTLDIHSWLVSNSPVDTGNFRNRWFFDIRENYQGAFIYAEISNNTAYNIPLIFGSKLGEKPWPNSGPKTVVFGGRVWSDQSVGNLLDRALEVNNFEEISDIASEALDSILG